jgi:DNA ligase-1
VDEKKILPFQELSKRKRKDVKAEDIKVKVHIFAFDLLYVNGEVGVPAVRRFREHRAAEGAD